MTLASISAARLVPASSIVEVATALNVNGMPLFISTLNVPVTPAAPPKVISET